ncbi:myristoylated alanine-rich C-kinase substrate-like [Penaeus vannamei]|uniref:myristoylated alanine-rich C-kinase substrate-like n=1 Tax=Penaeus vannamei TaxID=6689 RepID=UPI00387F42BD
METRTCIVLGAAAASILMLALSLFYFNYRRRPERRRRMTCVALRTCLVCPAVDGADEPSLRASNRQAFQTPGRERPPSPRPRQGPNPMVEFFRSPPIAQPTRVPSPPQETPPRRRAKGRRRRKAHRRSAHPVARRKSLVGACAEAATASGGGGGEGTAAEKECRADATARRADRGENDYARGRGSRRPESRAFRKGSGRRRPVRRGSSVLLEAARFAAVGRTPKPPKQKHSAEGLHRPEDYEEALPVGSPTSSSSASQREILTPPSPPLSPAAAGHPLCLPPGPSASAPPPTPAISPREMVSLLEQQAAASFPVPWVVVSAVAPSELGVWPPRPRHRGRLHPGLCLPRGSVPLTAGDAGEDLAGQGARARKVKAGRSPHPRQSSPNVGSK